MQSSEFLTGTTSPALVLSTSLPSNNEIQPLANFLQNFLKALLG